MVQRKGKLQHHAKAAAKGTDKAGSKPKATNQRKEAGGSQVAGKASPAVGSRPAPVKGSPKGSPQPSPPSPTRA